MDSQYVPIDVSGLRRPYETPPLPKNQILRALIRLAAIDPDKPVEVERDVYIKTDHLFNHNSPYNRLFRKSTGKNLEDIADDSKLRGDDEKIVLWLIEHSTNPKKYSPLFVVDRSLSVIGQHSPVLNPFLEYSLQEGGTVVYVCGGPIFNGSDNPLFELLKKNESYRLFVRYVTGGEANIKGIAQLDFDFGIAGNDAFLGELPQNMALEGHRGNYSIRDSIILRDVLITSYREMVRKIKKLEAVITPRNVRDLKPKEIAV